MGRDGRARGCARESHAPYSQGTPLAHYVTPTGTIRHAPGPGELGGLEAPSLALSPAKGTSLLCVSVLTS